MPPKIADILKRLSEDGWTLKRWKGSSHRQFSHPTKLGLVTVSGKLSDTPDPKTLKSIYRQAGWK